MMRERKPRHGIALFLVCSGLALIAARMVFARHPAPDLFTGLAIGQVAAVASVIARVLLAPRSGHAGPALLVPVFLIALPLIPLALWSVPIAAAFALGVASAFGPALLMLEIGRSNPSGAQ
jgi:hypothetical protein